MEHRFVRSVPEHPEVGVLYVSIEFATAIHKCCCGCETEVVTPLSPTDWQMTFDGETITLSPSIGNSTWPCGSHYWIERNRVIWVPKWMPWQTKRGRAVDKRAKRTQFDKTDKGGPSSGARGRHEY